MQTLRARVKPMLAGLVGGLALLGMSSVVVAQVALPRLASDEPAGFLVFPKIVVDTSGVFTSFGTRLDTVVQLTNTSDDVISVNCWYVDGGSYCGLNGVPSTPLQMCETNDDCPRPQVCLPPSCTADDFQLTLTPRQPLAWRVSDPPQFLPCDPLNPENPTGPAGCPQDNQGAIPRTSDPFRGELKCVQVANAADPNQLDQPTARNDLKGEATIYAVRAGAAPMAESASYNAIGIQANRTPGANNGDGRLILGQEYAGCPQVLILDHFFERARSPINETNAVVTDLTLVPCTEDLTGVTPPVTTAAQMLIYNEFEQRFSTSRRVGCFTETLLGDIDTRAGFDDNVYSVFAVGTQGTLTGQTRIRGVETTEEGLGHGLLGVALEGHFPVESGDVVGWAAFNLNYAGEREQKDVVTLSVP